MRNVKSPALPALGSPAKGLTSWAARPVLTARTKSSATNLKVETNGEEKLRGILSLLTSMIHYSSFWLSGRITPGNGANEFRRTATSDRENRRKTMGNEGCPIQGLTASHSVRASKTRSNVYGVLSTMGKRRGERRPRSRGSLLREESDGAAIRSSWAEEACVSLGTRLLAFRSVRKMRTEASRIRR